MHFKFDTDGQRTVVNIGVVIQREFNVCFVAGCNWAGTERGSYSQQLTTRHEEVWAIAFRESRVPPTVLLQLHLQMDHHAWCHRENLSAAIPAFGR